MKQEDILSFTGASLKLTVFDGRDGAGLVVVLTAEICHAAAIEDELSSGDNDWSLVRFGLQSLGWFPIVFVKDLSEVPTAIHNKIEEINQLGYSDSELVTAIWHIGNKIRHYCCNRFLEIQAGITNPYSDLREFIRQAEK